MKLSLNKNKHDFTIVPGSRLAKAKLSPVKFDISAVRGRSVRDRSVRDRFQKINVEISFYIPLIAQSIASN